MAILATNKNFLTDLIQFIDLLENQQIFNDLLYDHLLSYGINKIEFDKMIERVKVFSSYDENKNQIDFPYETWIEKLLTVYTTEELNNIKQANKYRKIFVR